MKRPASVRWDAHEGRPETNSSSPSLALAIVARINPVRQEPGARVVSPGNEARVDTTEASVAAAKV
jgi:hypothetical protein